MVFDEFFTSVYLWIPVVSFIVAQTLKNIVFMMHEKKFKRQYLFTDGGMFSAHAATMTSLTTSFFVTLGAQPISFLALFITLVVLRDAYGVRYETGKQAAIINKLVSQFGIHHKNLKELVGHSKTQVILGSLIGIIVALTWCGFLR